MATGPSNFDSLFSTLRRFRPSTSTNMPLCQHDDFTRTSAGVLALSRRTLSTKSNRMKQREPTSATSPVAVMISLHFNFRYEDESIIGERLYPAFEEYLSTYVSHLRTAAAKGGDTSPEARARVLDRHRAYDQYNAERDPAHGLFRNYFGEEFSEQFMDQFLFELSTRPPEGYPKPSAMQGGAGGRPTAGKSQPK